jgi:chemotaxis protein methyltransferase CheR
VVHLTKKDRMNLRQAITSFSGLDEPVQSNRALDEAVARRVSVLGLVGFRDYWQLLQRSADGEQELKNLVRLLTNKDAYFFREMRQFELLRDQIIPELLATEEQPLRIWSAGCAAGEEPYSLAIVLLEYQARHGEFEVEVIGTDIDQDAIAAAYQRRYRERAVRRVPEDLLEKYFAFDGQFYHLIPEVAQLVRFKVHNLIRDDLPPELDNLDVVFCRNVTMYLTESARDRINAILADSLRQGGYLFVASAEAMGHNLGRLEPVSAGQTLLFQKQRPARAPSRLSPETDSMALPADLPSLAPDSQLDAPPARKGRLVRATKERAAREEARRPLPPSLAELVAQAQDRVKAWSQSVPPSQPQEEVSADSRDTDRHRAALERARMAFQQQDFDTALSELDQLTTGVPIWTEAHYLRSAILFQQERFDETEAACQTMLAHDPWYADAHFMLGLVFRRQGQVDEALRSLEQAVDLEPGHRYAHFFLAEMHRGLGRFAKARSEYQNTLAILGQLDEPSLELNLPGLDDDTLRRTCEVNLEDVTDRLAES